MLFVTFLYWFAMFWVYLILLPKNRWVLMIWSAIAVFGALAFNYRPRWGLT